MGLSFREWACGYLEWVYRPESRSVANKSENIVHRVSLWLSKWVFSYKFKGSVVQGDSLWLPNVVI